MTEARPLHEIAADIYAHWAAPYVGAKPYIRAMTALDTLDETYGPDGADRIVHLFLVNARSWRGPDAQRIKAELRTLLDQQ